MFGSFAASVPSTGVVYNYLESTLVQKGFVKCYDQLYSHYTSSADLNACAGSEFVFVGAKSSSNANVFSIGAFGASVNVFKNTYSTSQAYYDAVGGAYWYRYPGWSFGFASSTSVNLNSCDYNNPDCSHRLCFHLDQNVGGYRAGCTVGINGDSTWRKVIYKCEFKFTVGNFFIQSIQCYICWTCDVNRYAIRTQYANSLMKARC